jgi:ketosteroid isomerase-like protein
MKRFLPLFLTLILIFSACGPDKPRDLTPEQMQKEKDAIIKVNEEYNRASEDKNWSSMVELLSRDVIFFGTDSAEIIRTFADFKKKMTSQWQTYDKMVYGDLVDISIQMDNQATIASVFFGVPCDVVQSGQLTHYFLRAARTLKKEEGKWVIVSGVVGIARTGDTKPVAPDSIK